MATRRKFFLGEGADPLGGLRRAARTAYQHPVTWTIVTPDGDREVLDVARGVAFGVEQLSDWTEQVGEEAGYPLRVEACDPMRGPEDMLAGGVLMGPLEADRRGGGGSGRGFGSGRNRGGGDASDVIGQFAAQALSDPAALEGVVSAFLRPLRGEPNERQLAVLVGEVTKQAVGDAVRESMGELLPKLAHLIQQLVAQESGSREVSAAVGGIAEDDLQQAQEIAWVAGVRLELRAGVWFAVGAATTVRRFSKKAEDMGFEAPAAKKTSLDDDDAQSYTSEEQVDAEEPF